MLAKLKQFSLKKHPILIGLILLGLFFFIQKCFEHYGFRTNYFDLHFMDHPVWNITQGKGLFLSSKQQSFFADHFYPYFYLIAPLYLIKATPLWGFLVHVICILLALYPVLKLAEKKFGSKGAIIALILLIGYYPLRSTNVLDLHGEIIMMPLLSWISYMIYQNKFKQSVILSLLLLFTKESAIVFILPIALFLIVYKKQYKLGGILIIVSMISTFWVLKVFMPQFTQDYQHIKHYHYLGNSFSDVLRTIISNPTIILKHLFNGQNLGYILSLFLPVVFLSFLSPYLWITVGLLFQNMMAASHNLTDIGSHYTSPIIPIIFFTAILGLAKLRDSNKEKFPARLKKIKKIVVFFLCLNMIIFIFMEMRVFIIQKQVSQNYQLMAKIPDNASVSASSCFMPHLHYRQGISIFPTINNADYVIIEGDDDQIPPNNTASEYIKNKWKNNQKLSAIWYLILGERGYSPVDRKTHINAIKSLNQNKNYKKINQKGNSYLYKKITPSSK